MVLWQHKNHWILIVPLLVVCAFFVCILHWRMPKGMKSKEHNHFMYLCVKLKNTVVRDLLYCHFQPQEDSKSYILFCSSLAYHSHKMQHALTNWKNAHYDYQMSMAWWTYGDKGLALELQCCQGSHSSFPVVTTSTAVYQLQFNLHTCY